jgi:hypothetical protein
MSGYPSLLLFKLPFVLTTAFCAVLPHLFTAGFLSKHAFASHPAFRVGATRLVATPLCAV